MEVEFCLEALDEALEQGRPEIFNTDQRAQFTSRAYPERLKSPTRLKSAWMAVVVHSTMCSSNDSADCHEGLISHVKF